MKIFNLEAQETFPGTLKVNMMNVLYFFVIYRLYLNCNAKLTAEWQVINYRHKILKQCYSNKDFLSENFLLAKSKKLLKMNLVFRASQQTFVLMKTSWRRLEDVFGLRLQKTSSRCLDQDQYTRLGHASSRRLQDVFKTSSRRLQKRLQDIFKKS